MSLNNITKAFEIVDKTYESVEKLLKYCDAIANENGYISMSDNFLRYKSDKDYGGWMTRIFVKLYQQKNDIELESKWRDGPVYAMFIRLYDEAAVYTLEYEYHDIKKWGRGISPTSYGMFTWPIEDDNAFEINQLPVTTNVTQSKPRNESISNKYWGLKNVKYKRHELLEINKDNVADKVFRQFDELRNL